MGNHLSIEQKTENLWSCTVLACSECSGSPSLSRPRSGNFALMVLLVMFPKGHTHIFQINQQLDTGHTAVMESQRRTTMGAVKSKDLVFSVISLICSNLGGAKLRKGKKERQTVPSLPPIQIPQAEVWFAVGQGGG